MNDKKHRAIPNRYSPEPPYDFPLFDHFTRTAIRTNLFILALFYMKDDLSILIFSYYIFCSHELQIHDTIHLWTSVSLLFIDSEDIRGIISDVLFVLYIA